MRRRYCFKSKSPTQVNLAHFLDQRGWQPTQFSWRASVTDHWFDFPPEISQTLEYKHCFAAFCQRHQLTDLIPKTVYLTDQNWPSVLKSLAQGQNERFLLKPSLLNNGQSIFMFDSIDAIVNHYAQPHRLGGAHVLQRYIDPPHLIQGPEKGHKYSIRVLMVLSTHAGFALFPEGYLNIALKPYEQHSPNLAVHLTNEHLEGQRINVVQRRTGEIDLYKSFEGQVLSACQRLCQALRQAYPSLGRDRNATLGCFGVDFMADAAGKVWLLEVNHGPCFPTQVSHPLYETLYQPFWQAFIDHFIEGKPSSFQML